VYELPHAPPWNSKVSLPDPVTSRVRRAKPEVAGIGDGTLRDTPFHFRIKVLELCDWEG